MKKLISMALAILLVCLSATGLASTSGNTVSSEAATVATKDDLTLKSDEKVKITFWSWEASSLESAAIQEGLNRFMQEYPNIEVEYMVVPSDQYHAKLKTAMASNDAPDLFYLDTAYTRDFVSAGLLYDLTDVLGEFVDLDDVVPSSKSKMTIYDENGEPHLYGMDVVQVGPTIFYNKDLFDAAGVEYIPTTEEDRWTWDEFVENMKKLTKVENGKTVQYGTCNWEEKSNLYVLEYSLRLNGAKWFNDDYTQAVGVTSEETKSVFERIKALRTQWGVAPDPNTVGSESGNSPTQMFLTGQVATIAIGSYALQEIAASGIRYGAGLFPKFDEDMETDPFIASGDMKAIWSGTEHLAEALTLMSYMVDVDFARPVERTGLWMPSRISEYEDENLDYWLKLDIYPDGWENMMYKWRDAQGRWFDQLWNTNKIYDAINEECEAYYYLDQDLDVTLENIQNRINDALKQ